MPAVEIEKLTIQVRLVAEKFSVPQELIVSLRALFESYADRTFRPGTGKRTSSLVPEYHLSPVIMRLLEKELGKYCEANPLASLELIDALWKESYKEPRLLASVLLGRIPATYSAQVIQRLMQWCDATPEYSLLEAIVTNGSTTLRTQVPAAWLDIVSEWLQSSKLIENSLGCTCLIPIVQDRSFENLPRIFDLFVPVLKKGDQGLMSHLQRVIEALAHRSPNETVYVLKQVMSSSEDANLFRLLRRCLPAFPEESRSSLRAVLSGSRAPQ
jgi:hypothetical protein